MTEFLNSLIPLQWSSNVALLALAHNPTYVLAAKYFIYNVAFILLATSWGIGFTSTLIINGKNSHHKPAINALAFLFLCISAGIAIAIAEIFLLVFLKILSPTSVTAIFSLSTAIGITLTIRNRAIILENILFPKLKMAAIHIAMLFVFSIYQLSSLGSWFICDATSYHVPYAHFFLQNKGLSSIPEFLIYPYHSLNFNLLYSLGLLVNTDLAFLQTIHALFATLTAFGVYVFCVASKQRVWIAILAPFIFMSETFIIGNYRSAALVDNGSMYFVFCTVFALYLWTETRSQWLLLLSAICLGIAVGTKYLMFIFAIPTAITIVLFERKNIKPLFVYAAWAAAWGLWWYLRNFILTGNPVHPFASNIFGMYLWNQADINSQMSGLLLARIPRDIIGFLFMPYFAFQHEALYYQRTALVLSILYAATPFCFMMSRHMNTVLIVCWIYCSAWFFGAHDPRYLMPIIPLIMVYAGSVISMLFHNFFETSFGRLFTRTAAAVCFSLLLLFVQQQLARILYSEMGDSANVRVNLMKRSPDFDLIEHANEIFGPLGIAYEFYMRDIRWFFNGTLAGNHYGPHGYERTLGEASNIDGTVSAEKLEKLLRNKYSASGFLIIHPPGANYSEKDFDAFFDLQYRNAFGNIYTFKSATH